MSSSPHFQINSPFIGERSYIQIETRVQQVFLLTLATGQRLLPEKFNTREVIHGKLGLNEGFWTKNFPKTNCFDASKMISETHGSIFDRRWQNNWGNGCKCKQNKMPFVDFIVLQGTKCSLNKFAKHRLWYRQYDLLLLIYSQINSSRSRLFCKAQLAIIEWHVLHNLFILWIEHS